MGQEFGWDTAEMACPCSRESQDLDERLEARGWIHLKAHSLTRLAVDAGTQLRAQFLSTWPLHVVSLCDMVQAFSQKGGWFPKVNIL